MSKEKFKFFKKLARVWEKQPLNVLNMDISMASIIDDLVKSPYCPIFVIPAKAGIQLIQAVLSRLGGTAFAGVTAFLTFYENIIIGYGLKLLWPSPNSFPRPGSRHRRV